GALAVRDRGGQQGGPLFLEAGSRIQTLDTRRVPGTGAIGGSFTVRWRGQDRTTASGKRLINRLAIPPDPLQEFVHRRGAGLKAKMVEALLGAVVRETQSLSKPRAPRGVGLGPDRPEGLLVGG